MKKIISSTILTTSLFGFDLSSLASSFNILSLLGESEVSKSVGMCYQSDITLPKIEGLCSAINFQINQSLNMCSALPDIPGLKKKSVTQTIGFGTSELSNYCSQTIEQKISSVTSNAEIWSIENEYEDDLVFPNGVKESDFYLGDDRILNIDELNKKRNESITAMYYSSKEPYHQQTAKYLIDLAKLKEVDDATKITPADVKVAENMIEYRNQVNELSASVTSDIESSSANSITSALATELTSYTDENGQSSANSSAKGYADKQKLIVENNAKNKKGLYKSLLSSEDDLAVPTQQTLNLYKDNIKPKYAMLIRKQQARDTYVNTLIDIETKIKQDIIDLTAKKAVIMKFQFDEQTALNDIDSFVD